MSDIRKAALELAVQQSVLNEKPETTLDRAAAYADFLERRRRLAETGEFPATFSPVKVHCAAAARDYARVMIENGDLWLETEVSHRYGSIKLTPETARELGGALLAYARENA